MASLSHTAMLPCQAQADELGRLQERISLLEEEAKIERRRADLYQQQCAALLKTAERNKQNNGRNDPLAQSGPWIRSPAGPVGASKGADGDRRSSAGDEASSAAQQEYVTITKEEYELLLLKDKAISVLQEGITIADATLPDMPLM